MDDRLPARGTEDAPPDVRPAVAPGASTAAPPTAPPFARVRCRALRPGAVLPRRMTGGSAGFDLHACLEAPLRLEPGRWALVPTGLVLEIPAGFEGSVRARSGLALRHGIGLVNGPGTIDSDYRGEVGVLLMNWGPEPVEFVQGDRIAQIVFAAVAPATVEWGEVDAQTARGLGGFGHTGTGEGRS